MTGYQHRKKACSAKPWRSGGFTLLELLVATAIFSLVILVMSTVYTRFVSSQRRQISQQAIQQDLRFALELLQREARTGYSESYALTDATGTRIAWRNQNGHCVNYWVEAGTLRRAQAADTSPGSCGLIDAGAAPLTSAQTNIEYARFDPAPAQRLMTIIIQASGRQSGLATLKLQTTVTSRQFAPYE